MSSGFFNLVLHTHLPYVLGHGRWPHGTDWLTEAVCECYVPILRAVTELKEEGIAAHVSFGITPVLAEQLADKRLAEELRFYIKEKREAARADVESFSREGLKNRAEAARFWLSFYAELENWYFDKFHGNLIPHLRNLQNEGLIEILTSGATHGYFPLLGSDSSIQAQIKEAVKSYEKHFGRKPRGIWLPECAYRPSYSWAPPVGENSQKPYLRKGVEEFLQEAGIEYFFIDSHLLKGGKALGTYVDRFPALRFLKEQEERGTKTIPESERSPYRLYWVGEAKEKKPAAVFTRDPVTTVLVWSGEHGYPGDGNYLDFHKKHYPGGLRYWKVTRVKSDLGEKEEYNLAAVEARLEENADHMVSLVTQQLKSFHEANKTSGVLSALYDTELFGHWWFEGPQFLKKLWRKFSQSSEVSLATAGQALELAPPVERISLPEGSWGEGGHHYIWLNEDTVWTWEKIYEAEKRYLELLKSAAPNPDLNRILTQLGRELLLLESSDWQFLISTFSARDYAEMRFAEHWEKFNRLAGMADKISTGGKLEEGEKNYLKDCEESDRLFTDFSVKSFWPLEYSVGGI
ncbi:MAG: DUF1957 domain-containing protein [candidate division Zixibacteria bacterium]|nr:DUF1957 domain-containing protein [candidate division Zixibacteria bacterium]